jgi:hypothetical protein
MPNLITWDIDNNILDLSGLDTALQDKLTVPVPSQQTFRIGFYRGASGDTRRYLDLGADPSIELIVKPSTGNNRFDVAPVVASPVFTRTTVDDLGDYYYEGSMDFSVPIFLKALGANLVTPAKEEVSIQCQANVAGSLGNRYFDIYFDNSGTSGFFRIWFSCPSYGTQPSQGGANHLLQVSLSDDDLTADEVASELSSALVSDANFYGPGAAFGTCGASADTVSIICETFARLGTHDSQTTGFTITVVTAGGFPNATTDVSSASYNAQLAYLDGTAPQISPLFTLEIVNSLYRDGQTFPAGTASSNYREGSVTLSTTDSATVTFSTALSAATYDIISLEVIYTGAGSPGLKLSPQTIDDKATTGFTVYLNGDATSSYRLDYKVTL